MTHEQQDEYYRRQLNKAKILNMARIKPWRFTKWGTFLLVSDNRNKEGDYFYSSPMACMGCLYKGSQKQRSKLSDFKKAFALDCEKQGYCPIVPTEDEQAWMDRAERIVSAYYKKQRDIAATMQFAVLPQLLELITQQLLVAMTEVKKSEAKQRSVTKRVNKTDARTKPSIRRTREMLPAQSKTKIVRLEKNDRKEQKLCDDLAAFLKAEKEVLTDAGRVDLLSATHVIEVKKAASWKHGLGQVLVYSEYFPDHKPMLVLFGADFELYKDVAKKHCDRFGVHLQYVTKEMLRILPTN